jgi:hypothetical protein
MIYFRKLSLTITLLLMFSCKCDFKLFICSVFPFVACYLCTFYFPVLSLKFALWLLCQYNNNNNISKIAHQLTRNKKTEVTLPELAFLNTILFVLIQLRTCLSVTAFFLHLGKVQKNVHFCILMTAKVFCTKCIIQNQRSDNKMAGELLNALCHISLNNGLYKFTSSRGSLKFIAFSNIKLLVDLKAVLPAVF